MSAILFGLVGLLAFFLGALILGSSLRRSPNLARAECYSRIMHFLFFSGLGLPFIIACFTPGLAALDALLGLPPLPDFFLLRLLGAFLAIPGLYLMSISGKALNAQGSGANAFKLTRRIVVQDIYRRTRNPMSLGYYLVGLAIGLLTGSTLLIVYVMLGIIPAHLFFLCYFEELELSLRFGPAYRQYQQQVPFLIPRR
jgi:protein-S-isoprenylcysteine O-methyltransferase Ste14